MYTNRFALINCHPKQKKDNVTTFTFDVFHGIHEGSGNSKISLHHFTGGVYLVMLTNIKETL